MDLRRAHRIAQLLATLYGWTGIDAEDRTERGRGLTVLWRAWVRECDRVGIGTDPSDVPELSDEHVEQLASLRHSTDHERIDQLIDELLGPSTDELWREAVIRAATTLARPHKHWRPDLVQCGVEQDALSILRALLAQPGEVMPDPA